MAANDLAQLRRWTQKRDAGAFEELVQQYAGLVYGAARRILRNDAEAEEIAQECFLKLAQADTGVSTNVPGWLHRTATNLSLNRYKENTRRGARETAYAASGGLSAEPSWNEIEPLVDAAINDLPESVRALVVRHYLDSKPYQEVAAEFGLTQAQVVYRIQRGVERIRRSLTRRGVKTSASGLVAVLAEHVCTPASAAILSKLGKIALAGSSMAAPAAPAIATVSWASLQPVAFGVLAVTIAVTAFVATRGTSEPEVPGAADRLTGDVQSASTMSEIVLATSPVSLTSVNAATVISNVFSQNAAMRAPGTTGPGEIRGTAHLDPTGRSYYNPPLAEDGYVMATLISWTPDEIPPEDPIVLIAQAGADNFFRFEDLPLGVWALRVVSEGRTALNTVALTRDEPRKFVSVGLAYTIAPTIGRVVDDGGQPIAGASIVLAEFADTQSDVTNEWPVLAEMHSISGSDGGFMLQFTGTGDRAPQSYRVIVRKEGYATLVSDGFEGGRTDLEFAMRPGVRIAGTLTNEDGAPVPNVPLRIATGIKWDQHAFKTDQNGKFQLEHLGPYEHTIQTTVGALIVSAGTCRVDLRDGAPRENLTLEAIPGGIVEGRIVNAKTGAGIPNIDIDLYEPGNIVRDQYYIGYGVRYGDWSTLTDAEGRFRFEGLPEGSYILEHGDLPGLPKYHAKISKNRFQRVEAIPGKTGLLADTAIPYGKSITGRVVNHEGRPLSDVVILASPSGRMPAGVMYSPQNELYAMTDARGRFQIAGLDENTGFGLLAELDKPFYIPEGYVADLIGPFEGPDDVRDVEIVMQPESKISATVIDETGQPMFRARVHAIAPGLPSANLQIVSVGGRPVSDGPVTVRRDVHWRTTGPDGHVTIDKLGAAEYDLHIDGGIGGGPQVGPVKRVKVGVGEHLDGLRLTYTTPQGLVLTGRVTDTSGRSIAEATVQLSGPAQFSATTKSDGSYRMVGIAPGQYLAYASHPQYSTRTQENFDPATATWTVQLVGRGSVTGNVYRNGAPVARFSAISMEGDLTEAVAKQEVALSNTAMARLNGTNGMFTLRGISAGDVTIVVQAPGCAPAFQVVRGVREGEVRQLTPFQLADEAVLLGTLLDADGKPLPRATVLLNTRLNSDVLTNTEGKFKFDGLAAGNHTIAVSIENKRPQQMPFSVRAGQTLEQTFRLREVQRILLKIELDGVPVTDGGGALVTMGPDLEVQNVDFGRPHGEPGTYVIDDVPLGGTIVLGFAQTGNRLRAISAFLNPAARGEQVLVLRMSSGTAALRGKVTGSEGKPLSSPVTVWWDTVAGSRESMKTHSNANGDYAFDKLPAGRVNILAQGTMLGLVTDAMGSVGVNLTAGQTVQYDLVNPEAPISAVSP